MCIFPNKCHKNTDKGAIHLMFIEGRKEEGSEDRRGRSYWQNVTVEKVTPVVPRLLAQRLAKQHHLEALLEHVWLGPSPEFLSLQVTFLTNSKWCWWCWSGNLTLGTTGLYLSMPTHLHSYWESQLQVLISFGERSCSVSWVRSQSSNQLTQMSQSNKITWLRRSMKNLNQQPVFIPERAGKCYEKGGQVLEGLYPD